MKAVRVLVLASVAALASVLVGCGRGPCTEMGADPSVVKVEVADLATWRIEEFCVADTCGELGQVEVSDEAATYPFRLTAIGPEGQVVEERGQVATAEYRVNGEGCPPLRSSGRIEVAADGSVTTS